MTVLHSARLVLPAGVFDGGWIQILARRIAAIGEAAPPPDSDTLDLPGRWIVPGFVDLHVHGGGGADLFTDDPDEALAAVAAHRAHGTTTTLASLVTAPIGETIRAAGVLADLADDGHIAGIHLEGPFLSHRRCGAQDPAHLLAPDPAALDALLAAGRGHVRVVTIAPELPGALSLVRQVVEAGTVAAIGHTDATYDQTLDALAAGARLATHLFNGARELHHRDPGPVSALLEHPEAVVELIADGVHLHDAILRLVFRQAGAGRIALITDAMAAAGAPDGAYRLGTQAVAVRDGVARLDRTGAIAGSTLTQDAALRRVVAAGVPIEDAVTALATTPARVLGLIGRAGALTPGVRANIVLLDSDLAVERVMVDGEWQPPRRPERGDRRSGHGA